jgi:hypothetical protein
VVVPYSTCESALTSVVHEIAAEDEVTLEAWTLVIGPGAFNVTVACAVTVPLALVAVRV